MRERLQEIATGAVDLSQRDEGAAEIVSAPRAEFEGREVQEERALGVGAGTLGEVASGDDEIVAGGLAAVGALPAGGVPLVEQAGERRVHGNASGHLGLRAFEIEGAERVEVGLVVAPAQARGLAVAKPGEALEGVQEAAVFQEANV